MTIAALLDGARIALAEAPREPLTPTQQEAVGAAVRRVVDDVDAAEPQTAHADDR